MRDIWAFCPLCDERLDNIVYHSGTARCRKGHYEFSPLGSYASEAVIKINGQEERFHFDDGFDDSHKFEERVKELRANQQFNWRKQGF